MPFDLSDVFFPPSDLAAELPPSPQSLQFRHRTVAGISSEEDNIDFPWYWTRLDHPALNERPQAILTVTPVGRLRLDPRTRTARLIHGGHPVGVIYRESTKRWYIYNLGLQSMELGVDFHVAIHKAKEPA